VNIVLAGSREIGDLNDRWEQFKASVTHAANKALGEVECKKPWKPCITLEMIEKMDDRSEKMLTWRRAERNIHRVSKNCGNLFLSELHQII